MTRKDFTVEDVIRLWLYEGQSLMAIAMQCDTSLGTVKRRLGEAREKHPELPWAERKQRRSQPYYAPNREYVQMADGKPDTTDVGGSFIPRRRDQHQ